MTTFMTELDTPLKGRNLLREADLTKEEFLFLIDLAASLRADRHAGRDIRHLQGRVIALMFEEASTRTRSAFEVAAYQEGASVTYFGPGASQLGSKESTKDTARVLGRMFDGIGYRGFDQAVIEDLGAHAGVPVWNGLTNLWHPTQMLADILTIQDHTDKVLGEVSLVYLGDGRNNTARSLLVTAALLGLNFTVVAPEPLWPQPEVRRLAHALATRSGASIEIKDDVFGGVHGADFVYTDVWVSMGEPPSAWEEKIDLLLPYQVNTAVLHATGNPHVKFLHCLPALHNLATEIAQEICDQRALSALEVTDEVFESAASAVLDQAENRLHTIKALMVATIGR